MSRGSALRRLEWLLWAVAVIAIGTYGFVWAERNVYQAYKEWEFERRLEHRPAPVLGFLLHAMRPGGGEPARKTPDKLDGFSPEPRQQQTQKLPAGAVIGRIEVPGAGIRAMILEGTSDRSLRRAVGHIEGTALPGQRGNSGLAGHRDTFFAGLKSVKKGDVIRIATLDGDFAYTVSSIEIVGPKDVRVLAPTEQSTLTLVTCYPFNYVGSAPRRYIVKARASDDQPPAPAAESARR